LFRTSQKRRQNIIYTFKKQNFSKTEDEKGVKDVYYMTNHVHVMCAYFSFEKLNPRCYYLLNSWIKIDSSFFALNLYSCGHAFFNVDEVPFSQN
jgi:hypothetical protein